MNILSVENISKSYGDKALFENLSFGLNKGEKVALIAKNGAGKSTILKIIAGLEFADSGSVVIRNEIRTGLLEQIPAMDKDVSINQFIKEYNSELLSVIGEYEKALDLQSSSDDAMAQKNLDHAIALMDQRNAWDYERKIKEILTRFNIVDLDQTVCTLSGGQKKRLALSLLLFGEPDLILLDEPTNHLDIDMIEWMEKYLQNASSTLLMVTHDRYFLDNVCTQILELSDNELFMHKGNYARFLQRRAEREETRKTEIDKARKLMKQELEWMRKTPQARTTKSKARINAFYETKEKARDHSDKRTINLEIQMQRVGGKILELKGVEKSYGDIKILNQFDYIFKKGERIGILGRNGVGKTSFLNILTGMEKPSRGHVSKGDTIVFGYYTQEGVILNENKRVIDSVKEVAEVVMIGKGNSVTVSQFLNQFMFTPEMQYRYVHDLSGGERRKLNLLTVLMKNPNFLILDEPTNDLDLYTLNKLEEFLAGYGGCLILVSHDRYFLDKLSDHMFIFEGEGKVKDFYGNYSEYKLDLQKRDSLANKEKAKQKAQNKTLKEKPKPRQAGLTYKQKQEYNLLEKEIEELEAEKTSLETEISTGDKSYEKLEEISKRIATIIDQIEEKTLRWMELAEISEQ